MSAGHRTLTSLDTATLGGSRIQPQALQPPELSRRDLCTGVLNIFLILYGRGTAGRNPSDEICPWPDPNLPDASCSSCTTILARCWEPGSALHERPLYSNQSPKLKKKKKAKQHTPAPPLAFRRTCIKTCQLPFSRRPGGLLSYKALTGIDIMHHTLGLRIRILQRCAGCGVSVSFSNTYALPMSPCPYSASPNENHRGTCR